MTIPIDLPFNFGVGAAIALSAGRRLGRDTTPNTRHMVLRQAAWWGIWFGLNVAYQYFRWPDWMWAYLVDPSAIHPSLVVPVFALMNLLCAMLGARCASALLEKGRWRAAVALMVCGFVGWGLTVVATLDAYLHVGTKAEYLAKTAVKIQEHEELQASMPYTVLLLAVPGVALLVTNVVRGRR